MSNKIKFYILSSIINFLLIFFAVIVSGLITEEYLVSGMFVTQKNGGADFLFLRRIYMFSAFLFPFLIYIIKNYKYHGLVIFIISLIVVFSRQLVYYYQLPNEYYSIPRSFKETILLILSTSVIVHFSQMIIGKKLLPTLYKAYKGKFS
ncbi:hypothetical protein SAMN05444344_1638 [Tenacibaculum mesophilum]|uniref:Exosortase F-associated protein n=1 Tax=Tenacibaculum mesophilum TaxID=104268 RepID=A0ABM7CDJ2_9FLAO|nr:hypothetical protein [Tenacibaculum mesophilum]AZJ31810.1 hypothetical protein D6200_04200 [Tenacibaculum mesophilum]QFS27064.1 hypothetical protein F9Y86_01070 [Tenacibaculum mesophilum]SHF84086.1 hypothetical protein SAMN05444344_1638 [Tenacibaculum mesophilum]